jgi:hypothetical protein
VTVVDASALYAALRAEAAFAGAELNVEGAARLRTADGREVVRLFARGNGGGNALGGAASATCDLDAARLAAYLVGPGPAPAPRPERVVRYDLGAVAGERLGFTDATPLGGAGAVLYVASAEASADVVEDGPVAGSAVGVIAADGRARWAPIVADDGGRSPRRSRAPRSTARGGAGWWSTRTIPTASRSCAWWRSTARATARRRRLDA